MYAHCPIEVIDRLFDSYFLKKKNESSSLAYCNQVENKCLAHTAKSKNQMSKIIF